MIGTESCGKPAGRISAVPLGRLPRSHLDVIPGPRGEHAVCMHQLRLQAIAADDVGLEHIPRSWGEGSRTARSCGFSSVGFQNAGHELAQTVRGQAGQGLFGPVVRICSSGRHGSGRWARAILARQVGARVHGEKHLRVRVPHQPCDPLPGSRPRPASASRWCGGSGRGGASPSQVAQQQVPDPVGEVVGIDRVAFAGDEDVLVVRMRSSQCCLRASLTIGSMGMSRRELSVLAFSSASPAEKTSRIWMTSLSKSTYFHFSPLISPVRMPVKNRQVM